MVSKKEAMILEIEFPRTYMCVRMRFCDKAR